MRFIDSAEKAGELVDNEVRCLVQRRIAMLSEEEPYDSAIHGYFLVVEQGDPLHVLEQQLGFSVLHDRLNWTHFNEPGFARPFEFIEEHSGYFEMVFVLSDDGYGVEIFVPKSGADPDLLAMCRRYAIPAQEPSQ